MLELSTSSGSNVPEPSFGGLDDIASFVLDVLCHGLVSIMYLVCAWRYNGPLSNFHID